MKITNATNKNLVIQLGNEGNEEPEIDVILRMQSTKDLPLEKFNLVVIKEEK